MRGKEALGYLFKLSSFKDVFVDGGEKAPPNYFSLSLSLSPNPATHPIPLFVFSVGYISVLPHSLPVLVFLGLCDCVDEEDKMAPRKEKVDKTSTGGGNAEALIVNYLSEFCFCEDWVCGESWGIELVAGV